MALAEVLKTTARRVRFVQFNARAVRPLLSLYYKPGRIYRIPFGPLRGTRLRFTPEINYHVMLGMWETEQLRFLMETLVRSRLLAPDAVVYDVGANLGYYTLWLSRSATPAGTVFAFEPGPATLDLLKDHMALNQTPNVRIVESAVTDRPGSVRFYLGSHHHCSSVDEAWAHGENADGGGIDVPSTTLDDFLQESRMPAPGFIKMDIEGGGVLALKGADRCVAAGRPFVFIESHLPAEDRAISDFVLRNGYRAFRLNTRQWVTEHGATHPNPNGIWGTMLLTPEEHRPRVADAIAARHWSR